MKFIRYIKTLSKISKESKNVMINDKTKLALQKIYRAVLWQGLIRNNIKMSLVHLPIIPNTAGKEEIKQILKVYNRMFGDNYKMSDIKYYGISEMLFETMISKCGLKIMDEHVNYTETVYLLYGI